MARIARDEYPKIQHLVDVEGKKVAEVAASYGCTPANIYAILSKTRRLAGEAGPQANSPPAAEPGCAPVERLVIVVVCHRGRRRSKVSLKSVQRLDRLFASAGMRSGIMEGNLKSLPL